jgi:hypothetical protein
MANENTQQTKRMMTARVVSLENGVQEYNNVSLIRIKSRYYNLLIMEGYTPSIGEIEGSVTIVSDTDSVNLTNVRGFYLHKKDTFRLMIREDGVKENALNV